MTLTKFSMLLFLLAFVINLLLGDPLQLNYRKGEFVPFLKALIFLGIPSIIIERFFIFMRWIEPKWWEFKGGGDGGGDGGGE